MSEVEETRVEGPPMICATKILKPGGTRIGKIAGNLTLPRTIPMVTAIATAIGFFIGLIIAYLISGSIESFMYIGAVCAVLAWVGATYSPLRGESTLKWIGLQAWSLKTRTKVNGRHVTLAVGTALAQRSAAGKVNLRKSCVRVTAGSYDDRGVLRTPKNKNTDIPKVHLEK